MLLDGIGPRPAKANGRKPSPPSSRNRVHRRRRQLRSSWPVAGRVVSARSDHRRDVRSICAVLPPRSRNPVRVKHFRRARRVTPESVMGRVATRARRRTRAASGAGEESPIPEQPEHAESCRSTTDTRRRRSGQPCRPKDLPRTPVRQHPERADACRIRSGMQAMACRNLVQGGRVGDLTGGWNQNQAQRASPAIRKALDSAGTFGTEAAELSKTMATVQARKDAQKSGSLSERRRRRRSSRSS